MTQKKKIYIAGPITNEPQFKTKFGLAQAKLEKQYEAIVMNPALLPPGLTQEEYMRICIPMLNICDIIYMLEGWERSVGAKIEYALAKQAEKVILHEVSL